MFSNEQFLSDLEACQVLTGVYHSNSCPTQGFSGSLQATREAQGLSVYETIRHQGQGLKWAHETYHWARVGTQGLRLSHLRAAKWRHLIEFDLAQPERWFEHLCAYDRYLAQVRWSITTGEIVISWRITGPRKNATLERRYF